MSIDDLRSKINRLDDEFKGDYDALLEAYTKLKYRYKEFKATIIAFLVVGILVLFIL